MICERCGNTLSDDATLCPGCGTMYGVRKTERPPIRESGSYVQGVQSVPSRPGATGEAASEPQEYPLWRLRAEYGKYDLSSQRMLPPVGDVSFVHAQMFGMPFPSPNDRHVLTVEILFSLFGIFGVGWLLSGRTVTGIVLLFCSIFLYWPFMIVATMLTLGIGLIFLGPFAIFCIIMNAFLLAVRIKRRAAHSVMRQRSQRVPPMR